MRRLYFFLFIFLLIMPATLQAQNPSEIWFPDIVDEEAFSDEDGQSIASYVINHLVGDQSAALAEHLHQDVFPRIVFISLSDGQEAATVVRGSGIGILAAVRDSLEAARDENLSEVVWIKIDIVQDVFGLNIVGTQLQRTDFLDSRLYGLALWRGSQIAFLPEEVSAYRLVFSEGEDDAELFYLDLESLTDHANLREMQLEPTSRIFAFLTAGYFYNLEEEQPQLLPLYRGHRMFSDVTSEQAVAAAVAGANYLVHEIDEDGRFSYLYYPSTNTVPASYNLLRHAGTVYSLLEVYQVFQDEKILNASKRAIEYLIPAMVACPNAPQLRCLENNDRIDLGGAGLAMIMLAKYTEVTGDTQYLPLLQEMGEWILLIQDEDGQYFPHRMDYPSGEGQTDYISPYYPGEAMLGLLRLYALDGDQRWLDSVERGAKWVITVRDAGKPDHELDHDHWLLYSLNELYRHRPDPLFYEHAMRISNTIIAVQHLNDQIPPDWYGGFSRPPRSTPVATRVEGLMAAYTLARDSGTEEQAVAILNTARLAVAFQLQTQFQPESVMYFEDPQRALGAFHVNLTDDEIRIDYVQHNMSALLALARALEVQAAQN